MIPTYNCSRFLRETIESVLINDPGEDKMQIEVIDDYSTDANVEELVRQTGRGRVEFFRQQKNVGSLRNFETCINRARGEWIHILHGDDKVSEGFYLEIENLFTAHPEAGAAFTANYSINEKGDTLSMSKTVQNEEGIVKDWLLQIAKSNIVQPPAVVVKRKVYEKLGSFFAVHYGEDWEMWVRIAANFPVAYSPIPLASYRFLRNDSISSASLMSGQNAKDTLKVIDIIQNYLPPHERKRLKSEAKRTLSFHYANYGLLLNMNSNNKGAIQQAKVALGMDINKKTVMSFIRICFRIIKHAVRSTAAFQKAPGS
jgi:glycosyltransferase involved in cell wall biosynthesis